MPSREFLYVVTESSYGTAKTSPVLGTDAFYCRLDSANAFSMEADPVIASIPYGGGRSTRAEHFSDSVDCKGNLKLTLYPGIWTNILMAWATMPIPTGRATPWTTTDASGVMPLGDLASLSFYHAYQQSDGTYKRTRYSGVKCASWDLSVSETDRKLSLSAALVGIKPLGNAWDSSTDPDNTEFPDPAEANYPTGPWLFSHVGSGTGTVTIGAARTMVTSVKLAATNDLDAKRYQSRFIQTCRFTGRKATLDFGTRLIVGNDDRTAFRALTAKTCSVKFDNGTHTLLVDYKTNNIITKYARDFQLDKEFITNLTLENDWSPSDTTDIVVTTT